MSDVTSDNDDISVTHEYIIAGFVILLFGLLYWLFNGGWGANPVNTDGQPLLPQVSVANNETAINKKLSKGYPLTQELATKPVAEKNTSRALSPDAKKIDSKLAIVPDVASVDVVDASTAEDSGAQEQVTQEQETQTDTEPLDVASVNVETTKAEEKPPEEIAQDNPEASAVAQAETPEVVAAVETIENKNQPDPQAESDKTAENQVVPTYSLPDGSTVKISANGFEGDLQQMFENNMLNKPLAFDKIYFETGSTKISAKSDRQIRVTAAVMNAFPKKNILLRGHTDNKGASADNFKLSLMRANSMGLALGALGIDTERIRVLGMGDGVPISSNKSEKGRKKNRRIEILLQ